MSGNRFQQATVIVFLLAVAVVTWQCFVWPVDASPHSLITDLDQDRVVIPEDFPTPTMRNATPIEVAVRLAACGTSLLIAAGLIATLRAGRNSSHSTDTS